MKVRLDQRVVAEGGVASRERARRLIMAGRVRVGGQVVDKPGTKVDDDARIEVDDDQAYVSRGGSKLEGALDTFAIDLNECDVLDVGASTGGFTDCVLRRGASRVCAVDVGYGQFAWKLRQNSRVTLIERTNARHLEAEMLPFVPDLAVIDVSFISLKVILNPVRDVLALEGRIVALVKPQFEVGRGQVGKGGVVRDAQLHASAVRGVREYAEEIGMRTLGECASPLLGSERQPGVLLVSGGSLKSHHGAATTEN